MHVVDSLRFISDATPADLLMAGMATCHLTHMQKQGILSLISALEVKCEQALT